VVGHTDRTGSRRGNMRLSTRRARTVAGLLAGRGVDPGILQVTSHGEENPLIPTPDNVPEPRNRRVEVIVRESLIDDYVGQAPAEPAATSAPDAAGERDRQRARERYLRGVEAYKKGRYRRAIKLFQEAARFVPSPALSFNIALAYEDLGSVSHALRWYRDYLRRLPDADDRVEVERSIRRLESQLRKRGVQQVTVLSSPAGATILLDGRSVGVTPWTGDIAPGPHRLVLQLRGYADAATEFTVAHDRARDVSVAFTQPGPQPSPTPKPAPVVASTAAPAPPVDQPESGEGPRLLTWITLGAGAATLGGAVVFEVLRADAEAEARDAPTQVQAAAALESIEQRRTTARVLAGLGGVLTATGTVLLMLDLSRAPAARPPGSSAAPGVGFEWSGSACTVVARGVF
jgi:tetratricopeptide (TPR) repeat protein